MPDEPKTKRDLEELSEEVSKGVADRMASPKPPQGPGYVCGVDFRCGKYECREPDDCLDYFDCKAY
jgi:hypothetical protein